MSVICGILSNGKRGFNSRLFLVLSLINNETMVHPPFQSKSNYIKTKYIGKKISTSTIVNAYNFF
jgi:hypothetical protein